jgi:UDP-2,3-diacylglucosamine pyrophosphatase LpxH
MLAPSSPCAAQEASLPEFTCDELHVVSDLHLGGVAGRQIFAQTEALAGFIDSLTTAPAERDVALVINGDIVDFLADKEACHFEQDVPRAIEKLDRVLTDFGPILDALHRFTQTEHRHLFLVIGNHDVELALPPVRDHLVDCILAGAIAPSSASSPRASARGRERIHCVLEGKGFACKVGERRVLCVHGNQYDDWNRVDYETVQAIGRALADGRVPPRLVPNGGTRLVIEVMNDIKNGASRAGKARNALPFIDLLKPEGFALMGVMVALDPNLFEKLGAIGGPLARRFKATFMRWAERMRLLSTDAPGGQEHPALPLGAGRIHEDEDELLHHIEGAFKQRVKPTDLLGPAEALEVLGAFDWMAATLPLFRGSSPEESLRRAMRGWMEDDRTFDVTQPDALFEAIDKDLGNDADFVVAGHTHLARALRLRGGGAYFNSGTWIRLLRVNQQVIATPEAFHPFYEALNAGKLSALERFDLKRRTAVAITKTDDGRVRGELRQIGEAGKGHTVMEQSELAPLGTEDRA